MSRDITCLMLSLAATSSL